MASDARVRDRWVSLSRVRTSMPFSKSEPLTVCCMLAYLRRCTIFLLVCIIVSRVKLWHEFMSVILIVGWDSVVCIATPYDLEIVTFRNFTKSDQL